MLSSENGATLIMWFEVFFHHSSVFELAVSMLFLEAGGVVGKFPLAEDELNAFSIYFGIYVNYLFPHLLPLLLSAFKKKPISELQAFNLRIASDNPLVFR